MCLEVSHGDLAHLVVVFVFAIVFLCWIFSPPKTISSPPIPLSLPPPTVSPNPRIPPKSPPLPFPSSAALLASGERELFRSLLHVRELISQMDRDRQTLFHK